MTEGKASPNELAGCASSHELKQGDSSCSRGVKTLDYWSLICFTVVLVSMSFCPREVLVRWTLTVMVRGRTFSDTDELNCRGSSLGQEEDEEHF